MIDKKDITPDNVTALAVTHGVTLTRGSTLIYTGDKIKCCIIGLLALDEIEVASERENSWWEGVITHASTLRKDPFYLGLEFGFERWEEKDVQLPCNKTDWTSPEFLAGYEVGKTLEECL